MIPRLLYVFAPIFQLIISIVGWQQLSRQRLYMMLNRHKHAVLVFPHTSFWDFTLLLLYAFAYPHIFAHVWAAMKPQLFSNPIIAYIFHSLHFIPATRNEEKGKGKNYTDRVSEHMLSLDSCYFLIAPEGMLKKNEWRSGYYWLAVKTQCPFIICGFDFEQKCLHISDPITLSKKCTLETGGFYFESVQKSLQEESSKIVPLYPEHSSIPIRKHHSSSLEYVIDVAMIVSFINFLIYLYLVCIKYEKYYYNKMGNITSIITPLLTLLIDSYMYYICFQVYKSVVKLERPHCCHLYTELYITILLLFGDCILPETPFIVMLSMSVASLYIYFAENIFDDDYRKNVMVYYRLCLINFIIFYKRQLG